MTFLWLIKFRAHYIVSNSMDQGLSVLKLFGKLVISLWLCTHSRNNLLCRKRCVSFCCSWFVGSVIPLHTLLRRHLWEYLVKYFRKDLAIWMVRSAFRTYLMAWFTRMDSNFWCHVPLLILLDAPLIILATRSHVMNCRTTQTTRHLCSSPTKFSLFLWLWCIPPSSLLWSPFFFGSDASLLLAFFGRPGTHLGSCCRHSQATHV
jgi:hypothetical protein